MTTGIGKVRVLSPRAEAKAGKARIPLAPRPPGLRDRAVGIIDNHRPNADVVAATLGRALKESYGVRKIIDVRKDSPSYGIPAEDFARLLKEADAVVYGLCS